MEKLVDKIKQDNYNNQERLQAYANGYRYLVGDTYYKTVVEADSAYRKARRQKELAELYTNAKAMLENGVSLRDVIAAQNTTYSILKGLGLVDKEAGQYRKNLAIHHYPVEQIKAAMVEYYKKNPLGDNNV